MKPHLVPFFFRKELFAFKCLLFSSRAVKPPLSRVTDSSTVEMCFPVGRITSKLCQQTLINYILFDFTVFPKSYRNATTIQTLIIFKTSRNRLGSKKKKMVIPCTQSNECKIIQVSNNMSLNEIE